MKKLFYILFLLTLTNCSKSVYIHHTSDISIPQVIKNNLSSSLNIPVYSPGMKKGDKFLIILSPGIAYDESELSFVSSDSFIRNQKQIDAAYMFSKLVNIVISNTQFSSNIALLDLNSDLIEKASELNIIKDIQYLPILKLRSATYNDDFYYTFTNPPMFAKTWAVLKSDLFETDNLKIKNKNVPYRILNYEFSASVKILNIERPWLKLLYHANDTLQVPRSKQFAIIKELILAKQLHVACYTDNIVELSPKGEIENELKPSSNMNADSTVIIGLSCVIL
jgi:hypothetical protein